MQVPSIVWPPRGKSSRRLCSPTAPAIETLPGRVEWVNRRYDSCTGINSLGASLVSRMIAVVSSTTAVAQAIFLICCLV